jgi:hypothetical protein
LLLGSKRHRFDEQTYPEAALIAVTGGTPQFDDQWLSSAIVSRIDGQGASGWD